MTHNRQGGGYHQVDISPWPILMSFSILASAFTLVSWLTHFQSQTFFSLTLLPIIGYLWFRDIQRESKSGSHTFIVQKGLMIGFIQFIISEVMLFLSFFWAQLHVSLVPSISQGGVWPPVGIEAINPWGLPLLGSILLLSSGFTITLSHEAQINNNKYLTQFTLFLTIILGIAFVYIQYTEYIYSNYTLADSVFGSTFYQQTGLHGLHVIAGITFLAINFIKIYTEQVTSYSHIGYLFAIWYWHLVDVVWLLVYQIVYLWG